MVTLETGIGWSDEAVALLKELAAAKAQEAPATLRFATALAWERSCARLPATSCAIAFTRSLTLPKAAISGVASGHAPAHTTCLPQEPMGGAAAPPPA